MPSSVDVYGRTSDAAADSGQLSKTANDDFPISCHCITNTRRLLFVFVTEKVRHLIL